MKRIILTVFALSALAFSAQAQQKSQRVSKNAIGIRFGDNDGPAVAASYQRRVLSINRLEFDLGVKSSTREDAVKLAAIFQWVFPIDDGFHWYVGVGGGLGRYEHNYKNYYYYDGPGPNNYYGPYKDDGIFAFAAGDIGIEYDFAKIPLQLSFDVRPEVGSDAYYDNTIGADVGLAARYRF
jgi:hypothetical protein